MSVSILDALQLAALANLSVSVAVNCFACAADRFHRSLVLR